MDTMPVMPPPSSADAHDAPVAGAPSPAPSAFAGLDLHLIGIGGCGLSGLALMLHGLGARCRGVDRTPSAMTEAARGGGHPRRLPRG